MILAVASGCYQLSRHSRICPHLVAVSNQNLHGKSGPYGYFPLEEERICHLDVYLPSRRVSARRPRWYLGASFLPIQRQPNTRTVGPSTLILTHLERYKLGNAAVAMWMPHALHGMQGLVRNDQGKSSIEWRKCLKPRFTPGTPLTSLR
ncbi:hypothetical protein VFPPC_18253 [Pochonia chlamydosporia 170]|uniref:Uncharacterized protein n=1 Tax=Pochonia chlamydosporia 170 TaxID=1380566 RepID=A0A219AQG0_METCM|nr:hypothetical protein VFPPC_18253 [Pochonia chlamydosporia 170]OWT43026.1 hypothetical protein VFPPC_18253 [Pochonia chlamydosporia 170]